MSLLSGIDLLNISRHRQLALPSFDVAGGNVDITHAICTQLAEREMGAFLASTPSSIKSYLGFPHFVETIASISKAYNVHVSAHLDHATDFNDIETALQAGCTSVMYDGSKLKLESNIEITKRIVSRAHEFGASVEAELGWIGGKEDDIVSDGIAFPTSEQAVYFVKQSKIDFFAPAIGTVHGFYQGEPEIQWELAQDLAKCCTAPLVLHGATGLKDSHLSKLIKLGFRKVNFATGVRSAFLSGIKISLLSADENTKPQIYLWEGRQAVSTFVNHVLDLMTLR